MREDESEAKAIKKQQLCFCYVSYGNRVALSGVEV